MNNQLIAREIVAIAKSLTAGSRVAMTERAVQKWVDKVNKYISKARRDDIYAVEPDSTWESVYEFEPVRIVRKSVVFKWSEVYGNKRETEKINYEDEMREDDLKWQFRWVIRAIKKGYREEGETPPKF